MQVILAWDDLNDVDIYVQCPNGQWIFYKSPRGCGGELDIDHNVERADAIIDPVENVVWLNDPPPGQYRIEVHLPTARQSRQSPYRVTLRREGKPDMVFQGVVGQGNRRKHVYTFTVP